MTTAADLAAVRRRDRAMDDAWIRGFLADAPFGFLATQLDGRVLLNSNLFWYDGERHAVYLHTARLGRTREGVESGEAVTFSAAVMGRLLPADTALEFSVEYAGVVVFGSGRVVDDDAEKTRALHALLDKYAPHLVRGRDYRAVVEEELRRTAVYRVDVEAWSGKQKAVEPDFPGAYRLPEPAIPWRPLGWSGPDVG